MINDKRSNQNNFYKVSFSEQGYFLLRSVIGRNKIAHYKEKILDSCLHCARELGCSLDDYLSVVSRWGSPSKVTDCFLDLMGPLSSLCEEIFSKKITLVEQSVLCKSHLARGNIPYHQDLSYARDNPYHFTLWLSLDDVVKTSGPLMLMPDTHSRPVIPAPDFWSPTFNAVEWKEKFEQYQAVDVLMQRGDMACFDSRLFHGSDLNTAALDRYALITRWRFCDDEFSQVPEPDMSNYFNMWNCGEVTQTLLQRGAEILFQEKRSGVLELIDFWQTMLNQSTLRLPFIIDLAEVKKDLSRVSLLTRAYKMHNGGDAFGSIFQSLWNSFLQHLERLPTYSLNPVFQIQNQPSHKTLPKGSDTMPAI